MNQRITVPPHAPLTPFEATSPPGCAAPQHNSGRVSLRAWQDTAEVLTPRQAARCLPRQFRGAYLLVSVAGHR